MVKIKNLKRRMRCFNLEHPSFLTTAGSNGVGKPESLTMLPKETVEVDDAVLMCAEIKAALKPRNARPSLRIVG